MRRLWISAIWLASGAAVAYASARHTVGLILACNGGLGGGAGAGLLAILVATAVMVGATVGLLACLVGKRTSSVRLASIAVVALAGFPLLALLGISVISSNPQSPLSCAAAYLAAGGMPELIVTVHSDTDVTLWRTREDPKPRFIGSLSNTLREACRAPVRSELFIVTRTSWRPARDFLKTCRPDVFVLAPAA